MLQMEVSNFRALRRISFEDTGKLTIIVGYNESGKTTLINAIKFAFTGEAFGHRGKDLANLLSHGEDRLSVTVRIGDVQAHRTTTTAGGGSGGLASRRG